MFFKRMWLGIRADSYLVYISVVAELWIKWALLPEEARLIVVC